MSQQPKITDKTAEEKVLRDPLHHYIHIRYQIVWEVLQCREFQRLRRIRQLGGDLMVYHTGDHSRFSHSLGVYEIARRMLWEIKGMDEALNEEDKVAGLLAALLHDIGHGPCSHHFEKITGISHEEMGARILLDPASEVHQILGKYDPDLSARIVRILQHDPRESLLSSLISSQLDADRMDYLRRDAYCTGTQYGTFDMERILRTLRVRDGKLAIKRSGVHSVEDYIMARSQMYWQVYLHPDSFGYELLISLFFKRYAEIRALWPMEIFEPLFAPLTSASFFKMDEAWMQYGFSSALLHPDPVLQDLASRLMNRRLFSWVENPTPDFRARMQKRLEKSGLPVPYYLYVRTPQMDQVLPYSESSQQPILVLEKDGQLRPLSAVSRIAQALLSLHSHTDEFLYFAATEEEIQEN